MSDDRTPADAAEQEDAHAVLQQVRAHLEYEALCGLDAVPLPEPRKVAVNVIPSELRSARQAEHEEAAVALEPAVSPRAPKGAGNVAVVAAVGAAVGEAASLPELRQAIGDCTRCKLAGGRTNLVFGVGNPNASLMFVGEGPGRDEDLKGEPFVGRAGQLLTEIITKGMKLRREDVYIANVVKCRPPENRNPEPDEIASCQPFLERQIELVAPKVIVALGKFAAQTLLASKTPISQLRGNWYEYHGVRLMPTLHPAYLLRNPADKRLVWEDIKQVMQELERYA